jgi:hypothetical protein
MHQKAENKAILCQQIDYSAGEWMSRPSNHAGFNVPAEASKPRLVFFLTPDRKLTDDQKATISDINDK